MKKLLPIAIILMLLLTACGDFAPEATVEPTVAAEYTYTGETYPQIYAGAAAGELARAVTAIMLGLDREGAAELVSQSTSAAAWEALASAGGGLALAADTWDLPEGVDVAAVATDALVFYVSPDNPVDSLTLDELEEIFTGAETNWSAFGGPDAEIVIMGREPGSGSVEALKSLVGCDEGLVTDVRGHETSEGVIGFGFYYPCVKQGLAGGCKLLAVDGVLPAESAVASGEYALTVDYLVGVMSGAVEGSPERTLWEWMQGAVGQAFISSQGFFSPVGAAGDNEVTE